jgi:hypothetical protein
MAKNLIGRPPADWVGLVDQLEAEQKKSAAAAEKPVDRKKSIDQQALQKGLDLDARLEKRLRTFVATLTDEALAKVSLDDLEGIFVDWLTDVTDHEQAAAKKRRPKGTK